MTVEYVQDLLTMGAFSMMLYMAIIFVFGMSQVILYPKPVLLEDDRHLWDDSDRIDSFTKELQEIFEDVKDIFEDVIVSPETPTPKLYRKVLMNKIKDYNLQAECKQRYGRPYQHLTNQQLYEVTNLICE